MKYVVIVLRILLGLPFLIFGLNDILHFWKPPAMPPSDATTLATIMDQHGWMTFVGCIMVISAVLLIVGRFVPLALTLLAPVLVNILLYHLLLHAPGIPLGAVLTVFEVVLILFYWRSFASLLAPDPKFNAGKL